jgi:hypothetical protein
MVVSSLLLAMPPPVFSFGTVNSLGQKTEHERITRAALACAAGTKSSGDCFEPLSIAQLAGSSGTLGAVGAPDAFPFEEPAPAHCDDADFFDSATYTPHNLTPSRATMRRFPYNYASPICNSGSSKAKPQQKDC